MISEAPPFWWQEADWRAYALAPVSFVYGMAARHRLVHARREPVPLPVLCVGNLTVGGTGKTPVAIALARQAAAMGLKPGFLSRGHGGNLSAPHLVDPRHDSARHVGDEPLLLAEEGPVAVAANRFAGARLLIEEGCDFAIMDDGFQSARIAMDFALLVVDGSRGIGNGHVIPGGPLRAPLVAQLSFADAVLRIGEGPGGDFVVRRAARAGKRVFVAATAPRNADAFAGRRFLAFAGIGNPDKFYRSLQQAGGELVTSRSFPDHHLFEDDELQDLLATAEREQLQLATTAKDAARLRHGNAIARRVLAATQVLEIDVVFDLDHAPGQIVEETLRAWQRRRIAQRL